MRTVQELNTCVVRRAEENAPSQGWGEGANLVSERRLVSCSYKRVYHRKVASHRRTYVTNCVQLLLNGIRIRIAVC